MARLSGGESAPRCVWGARATAEEVYGSCAYCHNDLAVAMTADGGHGSLSIKCELCHQDQTPGFVGCGHRGFYRSDGTGESHFTVSCLPCHPHERAFDPDR